MIPKSRLITDVFDEWQLKQTIIPKTSLASFFKEERTKAFDKKRLNDLKKRLHNLKYSTKQLNFFAGTLATTSQVLTQRTKELQKNILSPFTSTHFTFLDLNKEESRITLNKIINKYTSIAALLLPSKKRKDLIEFLHTFANELFFYIFSHKYETIKKYYKKERYFPLVRFIYSIIWKSLSSTGWSTWHATTLAQLKQEKNIYYFAGGTDITQLLEHEIYTFCVIDPFIPHQKKFYSKGWRFLIMGEKNDEIIWPEKELILKRASVIKKGTFKVGPSMLERITTTWHVYKKNKKVGTITFKRRTINQKDFQKNENANLISFNELYFIASEHKPWGIDVKKISPKINLFCKQLDKPVTHTLLKTICDADKRDQTLEFIQFGSNVD